MDALALLKADHEGVEAKFAKFVTLGQRAVNPIDHLRNVGEAAVRTARRAVASR